MIKYMTTSPFNITHFYDVIITMMKWIWCQINLYFIKYTCWYSCWLFIMLIWININKSEYSLKRMLWTRVSENSTIKTEYVCKINIINDQYWLNIINLLIIDIINLKISIGMNHTMNHIVEWFIMINISLYVQPIRSTELPSLILI